MPAKKSQKKPTSKKKKERSNVEPSGTMETKEKSDSLADKDSETLCVDTTIDDSVKDSVDLENQQKETRPMTESEESEDVIPKKQKTITDLTSAEEDEMVSWIEAHESIYNMKLTAYRDFKTKDFLWYEKAESMGKPVDILKTWYRSIRTRYSRLLHKKSGDGASEHTERDRWILSNFKWLRAHVCEVQKKPTVSIKEKLAAVSAFDDDIDDPPEDSATSDTDSRVSDTNSHRRLAIPPKRSSTFSKKTAQDEERLINSISSREEQSLAFQSKVLEMLAPAKATERTRFADWAKEVMVTIHPSLWLKFQLECSNLLYTFQEKSETLFHPIPQTQSYPTQQQHTTYPTQYQAYYSGATGRTPTTTMWPTTNQQWPAQDTTPSWGSPQPGWGQCPNVVAPRSVASRSAASISPQSVEQGISLSSVIRDTIGLPENTEVENGN